MEILLPNKKRVWIETSWDDGCRYDVRLHQLLLEYNLPGIFYIPTITRELTDDQIKGIARTHEIGGHTETHRVLRLIHPAEAKEEIEGCKDALEWLIGKDVTKFCAPKGKYNQEVIDMVKAAGFKEMRTVDVLCTKLPDDPYRRRTSVHVFKRREYQGTHWFTIACQLFDRVLSTDCPQDNYFHIWGHGWEVNDHNEWENLEKFFKYMHERLTA